MTALYVESPQRYDGDRPLVFLAGGISGCPDWQSQAYQLLADLPVAVANPRRCNFPIHDPDAAAEQIEWEHRHLERADLPLFWFPDSGPVPQPIALFELGAYVDSRKPIVVGCHPDYVRRADLEHQMRLRRPDTPVFSELFAVAVEARRIVRNLVRPVAA